MKRFRNAATLVALALCVPLADIDAQAARSIRPSTFVGDSSAATAIDSTLRAMYNSLRPLAALVTGSNPLRQPEGIGTEVSAYSANGKFVRIVATAWTSYGKYSVEYFAHPDETWLYLFESAIFRDDAPGRPVGRNFWGQPSWERQQYFEGDRELFARTTGDGFSRAESATEHRRRHETLRTLILEAIATREARSR